MLVGETSERTIAITRNTGRNVCVPAVTLPLPGEMACSHMKAISFTLAPTRCIFRRFDEAGILFRRTKTAQCLQGCGRLCVGGWLLIQVATQTFPFLEIPNWAIRLVIMLVALGFP